MTERLYYTDASLASFDATVQRVEPDGAAWRVWLDRSAFYPTSGGQPFDTGVIEGLRVRDVAEADEDVVHAVVTDTPLSAAPLRAGQAVHGVVDWQRRFDHMQQHTGQHILSAAFDRLFGAATVSFHMGSAVSTIDLARALSDDEIGKAEDEANRVVWEDRVIAVRFVTADEAARLPLRKESQREGVLRLIDIPEFDLSACGGTHTSSSGAVGLIATLGRERFKGGQRVEFVCGGRALARLRFLRGVVAESVRQVSVLPEEIPTAIERLLTEAKAVKRTMATLHGELASFRAVELAAGAEVTPRGRLVLQRLDADAAALKAMALAVAAVPGCVAVLVSESKPVTVVVARSGDNGVDAKAILAGLTAAFGGRGGGTSEVAQGGGLDAEPPVVLDEARRAIVR